MNTRFPGPSWLFALLACAAVPAGEAPPEPPPQAVCRLKTEAADLVNAWFADGTAAGNAGDVYDNRCGGHSLLKLADFPQLTQYQYSEAEKTAKLHWGLFLGIRDAVVIGNSSTSAPPQHIGSNLRQAYSSQMGHTQLYKQYRAGNCYVYPEHKDHDPGLNGKNGWGDLFPTNTPYGIISQGSSGSDQAYLRALAMTLAAFRPAVKKRLREEGLLMPAVQMILRRCYAGVTSDEAYRTGYAHPTVFWAPRLDEAAMVRMAHAMEADSLPPLVQLEVLEEDNAPVPGKDHFSVGMSETLADTPCVIARVHRRLAYRKRLVVSAAKSFDADGKPLTFRWALLRGDPERVRITPRDGGRSAEIEVTWHPRFQVMDGTLIESTRVDIGVFANNGAYDSAPGFVTIHYPLHQRRTYSADGRLREAWYSASDARVGYPATDHWTGAFTNPAVVADSYDIADWSVSLKLLSEGDAGPPAALFGTYADKKTRTFILEHGKAFLSLYEKMRGQGEESKQRIDALETEAKEKRRAWYALRKKHTQATETLKTSPDSSALKEKVGRLDKEMADAERIHRAAQKALSEARAPQNELAKECTALLVEKDKASGISLKSAIEGVFNAMIGDPRFYAENAADMDAWIEKQPKAKRKKISDERKQLMDEGLLVKTDEGWTTPDEPTAYQLYRLKCFHLLLLREALYTDCVAAKPTKRMVERLLSAPIDWRDTYRYGEDGALLGWTRHHDGKEDRFTPDGRLVTQTGDDGAALETRAVAYGVEYEYHDKKKQIGRVQFDRTGCTIFLGEKKLVDSTGRGKGVKLPQIQFLVFKNRPAEAAPYVIDVNHFNDTGTQTGWTRFDGDAIYEFTRKGETKEFVGRDADGNVVKDYELARQLPPARGRVLVVPEE